ncbi:beta-mannosyltransferase 4-like [Esox lucius]|uniref:beta-mannosyltransferase 4-like n=1 Tax=Esox lucius TaxID=8010 RepID=UPI001476C028|nr:beta-mannosyltransferase 4-like [Esox lucius]
MVMMKNLKKDKEKAKKMLAEAEKLREREEKKCLQKEKERKKAEKRLAKAEAKNNAKAVEELQMQEEENRKHQLNTKGTAEMKKEQERTDNDKPKRILLTENIILVRQANRMDRHKTPSLKESDSEEWADTDGDDESETDW